MFEFNDEFNDEYNGEVSDAFNGQSIGLPGTSPRACCKNKFVSFMGDACTAGGLVVVVVAAAAESGIDFAGESSPPRAHAANISLSSGFVGAVMESSAGGAACSCAPFFFFPVVLFFNFASRSARSALPQTG